MKNGVFQVILSFFRNFFPLTDKTQGQELSPSVPRDFLALSQERDQLKTILQNMREGVLVTDAQSRVQFANPALYGILPLKQRSEGRLLLENFRNQDIQETLDESLRTRAPVEREVRLLEDGSERTLSMYTTPILEENAARGSLSVFLDITPLKRLENARKDFVANVSHELKTPLTSIRGYAETLRMGALQDAEVAGRFVQKIEDNSAQLQNLIEDLLRLAEIESGRIEMQPKTINLGEAIAAVRRNLQETITGKSQGFSTKVPPLEVRAEPAALKQILSNLVDNASKYTPPGGAISISAQAKGEFCRITVSDTGLGIPPEDLPHVFERFYRVDKARSREIGGTGLGLAIVKHLVQIQGGEIEAQSIPGQGSQFSFTLPLASSLPD